MAATARPGRSTADVRAYEFGPAPERPGAGPQVGGQAVKLTSRVMVVPVRAWETGQFFFASSANSANWSAVRPGTLPFTESLIPVMPSPGWKVTSAVVSIDSGAWSAPASACDSAIEKQV